VLADGIGVGLEPARAGGCVGGPETDAVFARVAGGEGEAALRGALLVYDAVVVVEGFLLW
jgi:hypothetical protein